MGSIKAWSVALATATSLCAGSAQAACWDGSQAAAAQVREMETMLMVSSLRCRGDGHDAVGHYNRFVSHARPALVEANNRLRGYFVASGSGLNGYDRFVTSLANRYGGGNVGLNCSQVDLVLREAQRSPASLPALQRLASEIGVPAELPGDRCTTRIASR